MAFSKFTSKLRLKPDLLRLEAVEASLAEGRVSGQATLTRSGPEASLSGTVQVSGARLEDLVWRQSDRAVATGSLDLAGEFQGSGRSISALVASLAGGGTLQLADAELRSMNPAAFDLVIRAADAGLALEDDKIREVFASQLDSGPLALKRLDGSLALNGGRIALRNVAVDAEAAGLTGQALVNLNDWTVESDLTLKVDPGSDAVAGAEPQAALLFTGPLSAPERDIDVAPFTAFLTLRSFEQEVQRVERLQAEILERDRLMREVKYFREETLRRQQERAASLAPVVAPQPEAPAQGQSPATTPAPAAPARTEAKPEKASDAIGDLLNFETKIRSTLDASRPANAPANLLPLEPAREVGAGLQTQQVLESGDPLLNTRPATAPAPVAAAPSQRARQETAAPQAAPVQRGPRYVTDPNGLVITYPAPRN
ncbi:AsmA-like C-terminal region-containing protein [Pannonibacter sp. SL95]|uniref:AsmA-like C-terminal region-containing protein n=1 Tax=Pannonibacter sp. SL95 TaxID=2995153 RepID=UPI0022747CE4|nr:AsmA-like C-terminal region-containing protein [Pannonibacter sp. SL95]MCY1705602.1 AsmA-like C-terminal region-containing protein [Pannonibacter sp. SL95]